MDHNNLMPNTLLTHRLNVHRISAIYVSDCSRSGRHRLGILGHTRNSNRNFVIVSSLISANNATITVHRVCPGTRFIAVFTGPTNHPLISSCIISVPRSA